MKCSRAAVILALAAVLCAPQAFAQDDGKKKPEGTPLDKIMTMEVSPEKLELAGKIVKMTGSSRLYDELLPNIADQAKNSFIRANPQMQLGIISVVDKIAVQMVSRRPELDQYLARVWASGFSEEELQQLIDFYSTDIGKKYAIALPQLLAVQTAAAERWAQSVSAELNKRVQAELKAAMAAESQALQSDVAGPAEDPAPEPPKQ